MNTGYQTQIDFDEGYRKMEVLFEDGSTMTYDIKLWLGWRVYETHINRAAHSLFSKLKEQGKYAAGWYDHRKHPAREPGPKAVKIIRIWDEPT